MEWSLGQVVHFQNYFRGFRPPTKAADINQYNFNIGPYGKNVLKIFFSETASRNGTKLKWNGP